MRSILPYSDREQPPSLPHNLNGRLGPQVQPGSLWAHIDKAEAGGQGPREAFTEVGKLPVPRAGQEVPWGPEGGAGVWRLRLLILTASQACIAVCLAPAAIPSLAPSGQTLLACVSIIF